MENNKFVGLPLLANEPNLSVIKLKKESEDRKMKISAILKEIRRQHNLTQEDLAEKLQFSRSAIARWEAEKAFPTLPISSPLARNLTSALTNSSRETGAWKKGHRR